MDAGQNTTINRITVVGAGTMGKQISLCAAIQGFHVTITDSFASALEQTESFVKEYLAGRVAKNRLTQEQADAAADRYVIEPDLAKAVQNTDMVIEAVVEILDVKQKLFRQLDELCPPRTILASNSSYIVSSELAKVTNRPEKVCNMHFFAPALVMKLVEICRGEHTAQETVDTVYQVIEQMDKIPVVINKEIEGFIVNRLLEPMLFEAHRLADLGIASIEDIDKAAKYGLGHPMGPFELNDGGGLDLTYYIQNERYKKSGDPADRPSMVICEHYFRGEYGKKTGKGFYEYDADGKIIRK